MFVLLVGCSRQHRPVGPSADYGGYQHAPGVSGCSCRRVHDGVVPVNQGVPRGQENLPPAGPIRIARLEARPDPNRAGGVVVEAAFERVCPTNEWNWWHEQLHRRIRISGSMGTPEGTVQLRIAAQGADVEVAARELLAALDEVAMGYPANFIAWRDECNRERAEKELRRNESVAGEQAVLDLLMDEYRRQHPESHD
jgi:hypothetical protein